MLKLISNGILAISLILFGCQKGSSSGERIKSGSVKADTTNQIVPSEKAKYNIFIENSGSMNGYVKQPSDFKNSLYKLIGDIQNHGASAELRLNFINEVICPQKPEPDLIYFIQNLQPTDFRNSGCGYSDSYLPNIVSKAISTYPTDLNILVTDCIISPDLEKGVKSIDFLSAAQQSLRTFVKNALDSNDISCVILKMNSQFHGTYFIENKINTKSGETFTGQNRPYYILLFGNPLSINVLLKKVKFSTYPGFETSYYLLTPNASNPNSKIIRTNRIGDFEIEQPASRLTINDAKVGSKDPNQFQFSVASNLDFFKMDDTYLSNVENYEVPSNYKLVNISKNEDNTNESLKGYTHVFTLKTSDLKQNQDVFIKLKSELPPWVDSSSNVDDSEPLNPTQQKQTFGLKYLVEGISEAYKDKYEGKEQFGITVKVSSDKYDDHGSTSKIPWLLLLLGAGVIAVLIFLKNKKSNT